MITYLLTGILPFVLVINANFIQLQNNSNNTALMFLRVNSFNSVKNFKTKFIQIKNIGSENQTIMYYEMNLGLSDLAHKYTELSVKLEFQKNSFFFTVSIFQIFHRIYLY